MRAPPTSSTPRAKVAVPERASDDITTTENAPIVIDRTVSTARNLCARRAPRPTRRNSNHIMAAPARGRSHLHLVGGGRLDQHLVALGQAARDLQLAVVARAHGDLAPVGLRVTARHALDQ